jgi:hypothetical protein
MLNGMRTTLHPLLRIALLVSVVGVALLVGGHFDGHLL